MISRPSGPQRCWRACSTIRAVVTRLLGIALVILCSDAGAAELRVISNGNAESTRQIVQALNARFPGIQASSDIRALASRKGAGLYVTLGPAALKAALDAEVQGTLISLFSSRETYTRLVAAAGRRRHGIVTAIYAEASPLHQFQLIRALYRRRVSVGVLLSANTADLDPLLRSAASGLDLQLDIQEVETGDNSIRALSRLKSASVILAIPDRELYTASNIRDLLESTYRRGQPVIGFSASLVRAGTAAAAYSSVEDTIAQLAELVDALERGRNVEPQYPVYWRVEINEKVARSMDLVVDEAVKSLGNLPK